MVGPKGPTFPQQGAVSLPGTHFCILCVTTRLLTLLPHPLVVKWQTIRISLPAHISSLCRENVCNLLKLSGVKCLYLKILN